MSIAPHEFLEISEDETPRFRWEAWMSAEASIGPNTRIRVRPRLNAARWPGNVDIACRLAAVLTDNAVRHGKPFYGNKIWLRLMCPQDTDDLLIEVDDASPDFPDFNEVAARPALAGKPTGLWWVHHYRAHLAWRVKRDGRTGEVVGKTGQIVLPVSWGEE
ncbi:hypothetical protein [Streptomyces canus]|uniref:hypothetical protein n=1 Tax=Streptomyces canus TaxID=58343 RepID=UPI002E2A0F99|nr:hypothetical protein [Streptomyces canus]